MALKYYFWYVIGRRLGQVLINFVFEINSMSENHLYNSAICKREDNNKNARSCKRKSKGRTSSKISYARIHYRGESSLDDDAKINSNKVGRFVSELIRAFLGLFSRLLLSQLQDFVLFNFIHLQSKNNTPKRKR